MFIRAATLAAGLAIVASVALFAPAGAAAACPLGKYCTDSTGKYTLTVPPLTYVLPEYAPCVWQVHVNFGDSTSADYVFEGEKGLSGSHTFPHYGEFTVIAALSKGAQPSHAECPDYTQYAFVLYRDPAVVAEEETKEQEAKQKEKEEKEAKEKEPPKGEPPKQSGGTGGSGGSAEEEREKGASHPIHVWHSCAHNVYAHRVTCKKAQKVIKGAQDKLSERKAAKVVGFRCHLTDDLRPISCRRGKGRVLGPLG